MEGRISFGLTELITKDNVVTVEDPMLRHDPRPFARDLMPHEDGLRVEIETEIDNLVYDQLQRFAVKLQPNTGFKTSFPELKAMRGPNARRYSIFLLRDNEDFVYFGTIAETRETPIP